MALTLRSRWWWLLAAAACLLVVQLVQPVANHKRQRYRLVARTEALDGVPPEYILTNALLGGFRSVLIQVLWQRAQNMKNENRYYEMVDIYNITTKLQPGHHMAWAFLAWDLSYNVSVEFQNLEDRIFWVFRGIDLLRFQGIPKNDRIPELPFELSWIFHHKLGASLDFAHPYYRLTLANQVRTAMMDDLEARAQTELLRVVGNMPRAGEVLRTDEKYKGVARRFADLGIPDPFLLGPNVVDATAEVLVEHVQSQRQNAANGNELAAKALEGITKPLGTVSEVAKALAEDDTRDVLRAVRYWYIADNLRNICGMDPAIMRDITRKYGAIDWRTPYAHSLYWGSVAHQIWWERPDKTPDLKYERLVYFSLIQLAENSRVIQGSDGFIHFLPDPRMIDSVMAHMDGLMRRYATWKDQDNSTAALTGMMSAYTYFLRDQIFAAYFEGRENQAKRLLEKLVMVQWQRHYEQYVNGRVVTPEQAEWILSADTRRIPELLPILGLEEKFNGTPAEFVNKNMTEYLDSPGPDKAIALLETWLNKGYWSLALGDTEGYRRQTLMAQSFYQKYCLVRWPQDKADVAGEMDNRHYIPPLEDIRLGSLEKIYTGETTLPFTQQLMATLDRQLRQLEPTTRTRLVGRLQALYPQMQQQAQPQGAPAGGRP